MLAEACFVWNHALALQKRYYRLYGGYVRLNDLVKHFQKRHHRITLSAKCRNEVLERLDKRYLCFFEHKAKRPPKFRRNKDFNCIFFKNQSRKDRKDTLDNCTLENNEITFNSIKKKFKFSKSREYDGNIKRLSLKRDSIGDYYIYLCLDKKLYKYGKTLKGASVGIDFGLKTYLTLSDGVKIQNPLFFKENLKKLSRKSKERDRCKRYSNNYNRKRKEIARLYRDVSNKRNDFQWKLAHELCRKFDTIFIEDLQMQNMRKQLFKRGRRKLKDLSHSNFIAKLKYIASKYDVTIHTIDRYCPSSKMCTCGYVNIKQSLFDRVWTCPQCGTTHDRDLLAANNILRQGIAELENDSKTLKHFADGQLCLIQQSLSESMPKFRLSAMAGEEFPWRPAENLQHIPFM